ncbi:MAG: helix-turn-helix domain-containing protein [Acidobacteriaceae bacterium]
MSVPDKSTSIRLLPSILTSLRNDLGLRQVDLAKSLGRPQSFVSKYESGERRLDVLELNEICKALHVSLSEVIIRVEQELNEAK